MRSVLVALRHSLNRFDSSFVTVFLLHSLLSEMTVTTAAPKMTYRIDDAPPFHLCILLGLQQFLTMIGGTIATPLMVAEATCVGQDLVGRAQILGTLMFVSGICTLIQTLLGARLPIIQGASFTFVAPMLAMQSTVEFKCPPFYADHGQNVTSNDSYIIVGSEQHRAVWMSRLVEIQGAILVAGAIEALLGSVGVIGILLRAIGPLTIAPTIGLVGLSFADDIVSGYAAKYWPIALLSLALVLLLSLYLCNVPLPFPTVKLVRITESESRSKRKLEFGIIWFKLFGLFPVLLAIIISWGFCAILTAASVFPDSPSGYGYEARTDTRISEISAASWIRFPYPGQWGCPRVSLALTLGMVAGIIATMIETIGDFYACARLCGTRPPPAHAINRGIFMEGIACVIAGAFGCGPGVTSYAENIGAIAITRVASRRVFYIAACLLIIFGCITKIAAVFVLIPDPILGGVLIAMLAMVSAVGFSNLQFLDFNSTRNLLIFGLSMFLGIAMPIWVKKNESQIKTGSEVVDQVLVVLLSTGMLVGGLIGFCLDNTVPGATREQRGMGAFTASSNKLVSDDSTNVDSYDLPLVGRLIQKCSCLRYIPISPTFDPSLYANCCKREQSNKTLPPVLDAKLSDMEKHSVQDISD